jgi:hypothetical protein
VPPNTDTERLLGDWTDAGLITADQASAIRRFEGARPLQSPAPGSAVPPADVPTAEAVRPRLQDRMAGSIGVLGGLLVGLGVLLTVAANWESMGDATKVTSIVLGTVVANLLGLYADRAGAPTWVATSAWVVGALVFAGGIFLLGQIFNVRAHDPLGFLIVAVSTTAVAVLAARRVLGAIAAAAWLAWAGHELVDSISGTDTDAAAASIAAAFAMLALAVLAAGFLLDALAGRASVHAPGEDRPLVADLDTMGGPLRHVSLLALAIGLVPVSFAWHASDQLEGAGAGVQVLVALVVAAAAIALLYRFGPAQGRPQLAGGIAVAIALVALAVFSGSLLVAAIVANVLLGAGGLALAAYGLVFDRRAEYSWGVALIVLIVAARYVDVMVTAELGGLGFIGAGLLLIAVAWMVGRSRRIWHEREAT